MEDEKEIIIRTEEVNEILTSTPKWILRWGISVVFILIITGIALSYFISYPDILTADITLTTLNPPVTLVAKNNGKLTYLLVKNKDVVKAIQTIAVIENTANYNDVLYLFETGNALINQFKLSDTIPGIIIKDSLKVGELTPNYLLVLKSIKDLNLYKHVNPYNRQITLLRKDLMSYSDLLLKYKQQESINKQQLNLSEIDYNRDRTLFETQAISAREFENKKKEYLSALNSNEQIKITVSSAYIQINSIEKSILQLQIQDYQEQSKLKTELQQNLKSLVSEINKWKQLYLIESPTNGKFLYVNNFQIEISTQNVIKLVDDILPSKWQLANNGKIYGHIYRGAATPDITLSNNHWTFSSYSLWDKLNLGQISNPNAIGSSCNLDTNYISDYNYHTDYPYGHSLPDFPNFYIYKSKADFQYSGDCSNTLIQFYNNQIGIDSIRWYFLDNGQVTSGTTALHIYSQPGNYEVEAISFYGGQSDTIKHCINIAGQGNSNLPKQISICEGKDTVINGLQPFGYEYKWNTGDTSSALKVYNPGLYTLKYNTPCGYVTDSIIINTIYCNIDYEIPNVFTPNKDDVNDLFTITLKNTKQINYKIFNRWGNEIKSETITLNIFNSQKIVLWDGNINENIASNGTYFYLIELTPFKGETIKLKGFLNLFY